MKTMGKIYPAILLAIGLLFGSNASVPAATPATQTGWLLRTASTIGVEEIDGGTGTTPLGSVVYIWDSTAYAYTPVFRGGLGGWTPVGEVINAGEQFVFEWAGGGNDEYLGWPYAYVGDWQLTAPADAPVSGDVLIEWEATNVSDVPGNPPPSYAARVKILLGTTATVVEDLGLVWETESVVWHSQAATNGTYTIEITIVDSPFAGGEGVAVASITKQIMLVDSVAALGVSVSEITAATVEGYSPSNQKFEVWGTETLTYSISDNMPWLSCSPTSGSSSGEHDQITVSFDSASLAVGSYSGLISVVSMNAFNSPQQVEVVIDVAETYADDDGDGFDNLSEFIAGTDPTNDASFFTAGAEVYGINSFVMEWISIPDRLYSVLWRGTLTNGFQTLETGIEFPQNSYTDTVNAADSEGFYQIGVQLK